MFKTLEEVKGFEQKLQKQKAITFEENLKLEKALFLVEVGYFK